MDTDEPKGTADGVLPRVIKRYSNRKLYDTRDSRYVTLQQIGEMVRSGEHVRIVDNKTKEDKTEVTLAMIISEDLRTEPQNVPLGMLRTLIQKRGERILTQLLGHPKGLVESSRQTLGELQASFDERIRDVVSGIGMTRELRAELKQLTQRVETLEEVVRKLVSGGDEGA